MMPNSGQNSFERLVSFNMRPSTSIWTSVASEGIRLGPSSGVRVEEGVVRARAVDLELTKAILVKRASHSLLQQHGSSTYGGPGGAGILPAYGLLAGRMPALPG